MDAATTGGDGLDGGVAALVGALEQQRAALRGARTRLAAVPPPEPIPAEDWRGLSRRMFDLHADDLGRLITRAGVVIDDAVEETTRATTALLERSS